MKKIIFFIIFTILLFGIYINKDNILYNIANFLYNKQDFENALKLYEKIDEKNLDFVKYYNKGNTLYRISQKNKNNEDDFIKKAILSYKSALKIKTSDKETKENIDFLTKKLNKKEENKNSQNKNNENQNSQEKEKKENKNSQNQDTKEKNKQQNNGQQQENQQNKTENKYSLDKQTQEQIDNYQKQLKEMQKENQQNFQKKSQTDTQTDFFGNEVFFDNSLLEGGEKKDW